MSGRVIVRLFLRPLVDGLGFSVLGASCRRPWLVANRATLSQKWQRPPWNVADSCSWPQRLNQRSFLYLMAERVKAEWRRRAICQVLLAPPGVGCRIWITEPVQNSNARIGNCIARRPTTGPAGSVDTALRERERGRAPKGNLSGSACASWVRV